MIADPDYGALEPLAAWTDEGVRDALAAGEHARQFRLDAENERRRLEHPVRLDPELWRPPVQFHARTARDERREARREWRRLNRPFRRAFGGGELRRHVLHQVGVSNAKRAES